MFYRTTAGGRQRPGSIAALAAVLLIVLVGITAIALDGGLLQDNKRRVQAASDAAALAAASTLFQNYPSVSSTTPDPGGKANTAALASAATNGYANDGTTSTVTVHIPPTSGPFTGKTGYAEVIVTYYQTRYFSAIWGNGKMNVAARSVALGRWGGTGDGIILLDPTAQYALDSGGNGSITVTGGAAVIVDSNNTTAARSNGGGSLTASQFDIVGGDSGTFNGTVTTGVLPVADPLAYLPAPTEPPNGVMTTTNLGGGSHQYLLTPGSYNNFPNFTSGDLVILQQASVNGSGGIFYINGGGFTSNGATIIMDPLTSGGVMIYNNPANNSSSQGISIAGNASGIVNLSALTSGPYAGILFWQNRTASQAMSVTGNGQFSLTGTFYLPDAQLSVSGNGTATVGSQYISRTLALSGGGALTINYTDSGTARKRDVLLVE